jgi:hypothetical protein
MANKLCTKCKQTKPVSDFYPNSAKTYKKDNYDYYCKYCRKGTHLSSMRTQNKQCYIDDCSGVHYARKMCRKHYARWQRNGHTDALIGTGKDNLREHMLRIKYVMTLKQFNERAANGCEICGDKPERALQVDHDHNCCNKSTTCGKCVRGVICNKCNAAVDKLENSLLRSDYPIYKKIQQYLEAYNGK